MARALPTETKVESGTSQSQSGTSVNLSNSGESKGLYVTLSVGNPLCPYGIVHHRVYEVSDSGLFKKPLCSQVPRLNPQPLVCFAAAEIWRLFGAKTGKNAKMFIVLELPRNHQPGAHQPSTPGVFRRYRRKLDVFFLF